MLFWGWGRRSKRLELSPEQVLALTYRYFHLFFVFTAAFGGSYALLTLTDHGWASAPVATEEAERLLSGRHLRPNPWQRFSLYGFLVVIALFIATGSRH